MLGYLCRYFRFRIPFAAKVMGTYGSRFHPFWEVILEFPNFDFGENQLKKNLISSFPGGVPTSLNFIKKMFVVPAAILDLGFVLSEIQNRKMNFRANSINCDCCRISKLHISDVKVENVGLYLVLYLVSRN